MSSTPLGEFSLIARYFNRAATDGNGVDLAVGDDAALLSLGANEQLVVSTDTMVAGSHFLAEADPRLVGHKALASNLSDIIAMGATPRWVSLALTLPQIDEAWLAGFCDGFFALAKAYKVDLVGGDTTKGPLAITITIHGTIPRGKAWLRSGANVGDTLYIAAPLGESQAGLDFILDNSLVSEQRDALIERHFCTYPRQDLLLPLRDKVSAALDISDGLIADLGHILRASHVGASIDVDRLPLTERLLAHCDHNWQKAVTMALTSGEEYTLCFTSSAALDCAALNIFPIGVITEDTAVVLTAQGEPLDWQLTGFEHFGDSCGS
uniref:thiamine-phosphate kinase n=1 Tax=Thaumasiovibrio occultus TaxID=1891184 RepID=UPI000B3557D8|nr:thiamine-phosphate kinase [Thaumasiovibrio occultus]